MFYLYNEADYLIMQLLASSLVDAREEVTALLDAYPIHATLVIVEHVPNGNRIERHYFWSTIE